MSVWVPVLASMKGFISEVEKGAGQASKSAGKALEKGLSDAGKAGGESAADELAKAVGAASQKVAAARKKEAGAAADLTVAEEQLAQVRAQGDATAGQIMAAEAKVDDARRRQESSAARLSAAEQDLQAAREGGETRISGIVTAETRLEDARLSAQAAAEKVAVAEQKADDARQVSLSATQKAESAEVQLALAKAEHGEGSREASQAERELERARTAAGRASVAVEKAEGSIKKERAAAATASEKAEVAELQLDAAHDKVAQSARKASSETGSLSDDLSGLEDAAGLAATAMGALGLGLAAGEIMDSAGAINQMNNQLGLTGDAAGYLGDQVGDVMRTGLAGSTEEAALAVGSLSAQFDNLGSAGEQSAAELADNFLAFTQTFGTSMEEATQTAGQLIQNGLAGDVEEAADLMTAAMQRVPAAMRDEIPEIINEYGTNFRALGFSGEEAFGLLVGAADKGKWALDKTGDALKEFTIRGSDMSTGSVAAFEAIGLSAEEMSAKIAEGGPGARDALNEVAQGILGIEDPAERANTAIALFGTPLEDLSVDQIPQFLEGLTGAEDAMDGFGGASGELSDSIENSLTGRLNALKGAVMGVATDGFMFAWDIVSGFIDLLGPFAPVLGSIVVGLGAAAGVLGVVAGAIKMVSVATAIWNAVLNMNPLARIIAVITGVVAALVWFFTQTETGKAIWSGFVDFLGAAWEKIKGFFTAAWEAIKPVWDGIADGAMAMWEKMQPVFDWIAQAWQKVVDFFTGGEAGGGFLDTLAAKFTEFGTGVSQWYQTWIAPMVNLFKAGIDLLVQAVTWWVQNVTLPALSLLGQAFQMVWNGFIKPIWDAFKVAVGIVGQVFMGFVNGGIVPLWNFVGQQIQNVWNNIINPVWEFIKSAAGLLADILTGNFENIGNRFSEMGSAIDGIVRGVIQFAMDTFRNIVEMVGNAWTAFRDTVSNVVSAVAGYISDMMGKIRDIPTQVKNLFSNAGQWLVSAGSRIINGLWEGMKNAWSNVKSWLSENLSFSAVGSIVGLSGGGIVMANGGIVEQYVSGGITQLEHYANGGGRENHTAQIAPAGAWRVWAEEETGGEAYIPLASSKRGRSTAILDEVAGRFGYDLVDSATGQVYGGGYSGDLGPQHVTQFADGAVVTSDDFTRFVHGDSINGEKASGSLEGWPYNNYPSDPGAWGDCSYTVGKVSALAVGRRTAGRHFATGTQASVLSSWGFTRGRGAEGDLLIGFKNGGPAGGHTSGTLPDGTNFEMGGGRGNGQIGGGAAGAWDSYYTDFFHMPVGPTFENVELDDLGDLATGGYSPVAEAEAITADASGTTATQDEPDTISGRVGKVTEEAVSGHVADFLGVVGVPDTLPSWVTGAEEVHQAATSPRTSVAEEHAEANQDAAVTSMTADEINADPQLSGMDSMDVTVQPEVPEWGPEFFAYEIARQAKAMDLSADGAKIGVATALVESGDPLQMYANNRVPESLNYRHDAVGSDHDSVGLFQQRDNGAWGTVAQRMDPFESAGMFFRELVKFDWESMDPGAAAQKVQRSAFPDRYATKMSRAEEMVAGTGLYDPVAEAEAITADAAAADEIADKTALYDQGGVLDDEHLALNLSGKPEAVLTNDQWQMLSGLGESLPDMVGSTVSGTVSSGITAAAGMANTVMPGAGAAFGPAAQLGGWYAGEVASGWTSAIMQASQQALDIAREPLADLQSQFAGPVAPVVDQVRARFGEIPQRPSADIARGEGTGPAPVVINVQNMDQAYEAKRHLEARALAGFM